MDKLKLLEWSLNMSSDKDAKPYKDFFVEIYKINPDVVFLMETVKNNENILMNSDLYTTIIESDNPTGGNTVTIAIKTELLHTGRIKVISKYKKMNGSDFYSSPNFAQVDISINGFVYNLIAIRIRTNNSNIEDFKDRRKQLNNFLNYVSAIENPIIMGDFNNSFIHGYIKTSANSIINDVKYKDKIQVKSNYFYQKIAEDFENIALTVYTPVNGYSYGLCIDEKNKTIKKGYNYENKTCDWGYLKIDHLVINNSYLKVNQIKYQWDFLEQVKGDVQMIELDRKRNMRIKKGFPDHAILIADVELK